VKEEILRRTLEFAKKSIALINKLPNNVVNQILKKQYLRAATSVGSNYREACEAESRKDFVHKLGVYKKESRESGYWIELIGYQNPKLKEDLEFLTKEAKEFLLMFSKSIKTSKERICSGKQVNA